MLHSVRRPSSAAPRTQLLLLRETHDRAPALSPARRASGPGGTAYARGPRTAGVRRRPTHTDVTRFSGLHLTHAVNMQSRLPRSRVAVRPGRTRVRSGNGTSPSGRPLFPLGTYVLRETPHMYTQCVFM